MEPSELEERGERGLHSESLLVDAEENEGEPAK